MDARTEIEGGVALVAVTRVRRGTGPVKPGKPFTAAREEADELIALGSARPDDGKDTDKADAPDPDARTEAIRAFVEGAITDADWTADGTPKVAAVREATGITDIAADELAAFRKA